MLWLFILWPFAPTDHSLCQAATVVDHGGLFMMLGCWGLYRGAAMLHHQHFKHHNHGWVQRNFLLA